MLTISAEQMAVFSRAIAKQFEDQTLARLRKDFPKSTSGYEDDDLRKVIRRGVKTAKDYGIRIESDVGCFIDHKLLLGSDFHTRLDWAREILNDKSLDGSRKVDRLEERRIFGSRKRSHI